MVSTTLPDSIFTGVFARVSPLVPCLVQYLQRLTPTSWSIRYQVPTIDRYRSISSLVHQTSNFLVYRPRYRVTVYTVAIVK